MKNLLLVFAFACLAIPSFGQFSVGLSAGVNQTFWKWHFEPLNLDIDINPEFGYRGALMGEYKFSSVLTARAEFGAQKKANHAVVGFTDEESKGYLHENYLFLEGSLLLQISPLKKVAPLYLLLGGTYGRLTKGWRAAEGVGPAFSEGPQKSDIELDPVDYNLNAFASDLGLGWNVQLNARNQVKIEGRFQYTLTDFFSNENVEAKANPLMLTVGYMHRL